MRQQIDPLAAMAALNPADAAQLATELSEADLERELVRAMSLGQHSPPASSERLCPLSPTGRQRTKALAGVGYGLAAVLALAALAVFGGLLGGSGGSRPEFAAAAVRVAEANPRLLVTAPGWKIVRADEFEPDLGQLTFGDGAHRLELHWYPANLYRGFLRDRADVSRPEHGTLLGQRVTTVEYSPVEFATMLSPQGEVFIELRGNLGSRRAYDRVLDSLRPVAVDTWLEAMPPGTVRPAQRAAAVDRMLHGTPLPPGFDPAALQHEAAIADRPMLATKVANAVACAWTRSWVSARASGDEVAAQQAIAGLASWRGWPVVSSYEREVSWFTNYAVVVKQLRANRLNRGYAGYLTEADGTTYGFGPAWKLTLGCEGTYRREVDGVPELSRH